MACRCGDISDCKNDISVISSILSTCRGIKSTKEEDYRYHEEQNRKKNK